jgi:hypothetical protein
MRVLHNRQILLPFGSRPHITVTRDGDLLVSSETRQLTLVMLYLMRTGGNSKALRSF